MAVLHVYKLGSNTYPYATKATGSLTIQNAIDRSAPGDVIIVHGACAGSRCVYQENVRVVRGLTLTGEDWPIVDGRRLGPCITIERILQRVTISGFEIINGHSRSDGGGINSIGSVVTIENNCIHDNRAAAAGGGVSINESGHTLGQSLEVRGNHIHRNLAVRGGGIVVFGPLGSGPSNVLIERNVIGPQNRANKGGGVHVSRGNVVVKENRIVQNHAFSGPVAARGAGVHAQTLPDTPLFAPIVWSGWGLWNARQVYLEGNDIRLNRSEEDGGGLAAEWGGSIVCRNNNISRNSADDDGGGAYASVKAQLTFEGGNLIAGNEARNNGGGFQVTCTSRVRFQGSDMVYRNVSHTGDGGGISVRNAELHVSGGLKVYRNVARAGMGGGIIVRSESFTWSSLTRAFWSACEMDALCSIRGAHLYGNSAAGQGGGIAVIKGAAMFPRQPTLVEGSILAANRSRLSGAGIYYRAPHSLRSFTPVFRGNELTGHTSHAASAGLVIEGIRLSVYALIERNVVRGNSNGLLIESCHARVENNWFDGQLGWQIEAHSSRWDIYSNELKGSGGTRFGIDVNGSSWWSEARNNNIHGHARFGFRVLPGGQRASARNCWWGHASGPTVAGGPPRGDPITPNVIWSPQQGQPLGLAAPRPIVIPRFQRPALQAVTFRMPSEFFPDLACDAEALGDS